MSNTGSSIWDQLKSSAYEVLGNVFGFTAFRGVQEEAVKAALTGRDCLVLMPTGGGKSLCYALPAVVKGGLVIVVSPLIALMQDQVSALQERGIAADYLSSTRSTADRKAVLSKFAAASNRRAAPQPLTLLYVTPELLATDKFRQLLVSLHNASALQFLAVDEAHCISSWGHDFRPTYRKLAALRSQLQGLPCMALTATATVQVQEDIIQQLHMHQPVKLMASFNRPNIHYSVVYLDLQSTQTSAQISRGKQGIRSSSSSTTWPASEDELDVEASDVDFAGYQQLLQLLTQTSEASTSRSKQQQDQSIQHENVLPAAIDASSGRSRRQAERGPVSIVYALKRSTVDTLVRRLSSAGVAVAGYHAAMPDGKREQVLQKWREGQLQVVVATVAFGMGVDKGDIEMVVHFNLPRTVEAFYQESGRAGRNGAPAKSVLFYSIDDVRRMNWILQKYAEKKEASKRKKAAQTTTAAAKQSSTDDTLANPAAASALKAFGGVVDLCTQLGCKRARLLAHFGETMDNSQHPQQQQQQQQQQASSATAVPPAQQTLQPLPADQQAAAAHKARTRCCDHCDNPELLAAFVQQLKDKETELLQLRLSRTGYRNKRQKAVNGGVLADMWRAADSNTDDSQSECNDSDVELDHSHELDLAVAAAVARAAAVAQGAQGKCGATVIDAVATDAFLSAMTRAEQQHDRQQQSADDDDAFGRLLAARKKQATNHPNTLTNDLRISRKSRLAEVIISNTSLYGANKENASVIAASLESTIYKPGMTAGEHSVSLKQLVSAVRTTQDWLDLPAVSKMEEQGLAVVITLTMDAAVQKAAHLQKASSPSEQDAGKLAAVLSKLATLPVTAAVLEQTGAGGKVKGFRKHNNKLVAEAARHTIDSWRRAIS